jgi:hypothetical protein
MSSTWKKITNHSLKRNGKLIREASLSFEAISLQPLFTYDGLERLENSAPLGPGCGGRAEESHLLCIKLHRDIAYKRPGRSQPFVLWIGIVLVPVQIRILLFT